MPRSQPSSFSEGSFMNTMSRITKIVKGSAYMMSTMRIMTRSVLPPRKPATAP